MGTFVVWALLTKKEAQFAYDGIKKWFAANPDRDDCQTETFIVRRDHVKEDILANAEKGVVLVENRTSASRAKKSMATSTKASKKTTKKKVTAKAPKKKSSKKIHRKVGRG